MTAIEKARERGPMPNETIQELIGCEPDSPSRAAERDVRDILDHMSAEFEALVHTMVEGASHAKF